MDHREISHKWYQSFDSRAMTLTVDFGHEVIDVPAEYEVCDVCEGKGKHTNPSIDRNGLTASDFDEDPDLYENYFSGMYDVACVSCKGERVVPVPAYDRMTPDMILRVNDVIQSYYAEQRDAWHEREYGY